MWHATLNFNFKKMPTQIKKKKKKKIDHETHVRGP
jgi:hypothetical protein